jgi:hypothetical protein
MAKLYEFNDRAIAERDLYNRFDEYLDDSNDPVLLCDRSYLPSHVFRHINRTLYEREFIEWLAWKVSERAYIEKDGKYYPAEDGYDE